ncbi:MAG: hypothetical protein ACPIC5_07415 [Candidatus Poseidoniaceae archaeon]
MTRLIRLTLLTRLTRLTRLTVSLLLFFSVSFSFSFSFPFSFYFSLFFAVVRNRVSDHGQWSGNSALKQLTPLGR